MAWRPSSHLRGALAIVVLMAIGFGGLMLFHPKTPLPPEWNPFAPLRIADPVTPVTGWKLARIGADGAACHAVLADAGVDATPLPDLVDSEQCHIRDRVRLGSAGAVPLNPVETRCAIALRLAMWERHTLAPAARRIYGQDLARVDHLSSYSCRAMRTGGGGSGRLSTHATADAIDISGLVLADGTRIRLTDWPDGGSPGAFLRAARDGACRFFVTALGPDYNALHADHFHLQSRGWGTCR